MSENPSTVAVAFSGGLDTSWCVPVLLDEGFQIVTVTVDVGGFDADEVANLKAQSRALGTTEHVHINAQQEYWERIVRHLLAGHIVRGGTYPLCVGAERALQAELVGVYAKQHGIKAVAHGCTAAGNDQVRFEVALRSTAPGVTILAPVRDLAPSRPDQVALLESRGLPVPVHGAAYSVNSGLWGVTIGGKETTGTTESLPDEQWLRTKKRGAQDDLKVIIGFEKGQPVSLDGEALNPVNLIERLDDLAGARGIGRGIHLGETILGIKGRVAFEAPAATVLMAAHKELQKLTTTKRQQQAADAVAVYYGEMVHEGLFVDPACRAIEALFDSVQERVTGTVDVLLSSGGFLVTGCDSPFSLHRASRAVYGEAVGEWTPADAKGFCAIYGLSSVLYARAGEEK
ncbi:MAG: argininosuccinate synthase [bacterium]